jgi:hypothetical protein
MTRGNLLVAASLACLSITGCSCGTVHEPITPPSSPSIVIEKPKALGEITRGEPLIVEGELKIEQGDWTPGVIVVEINKDKSGSNNQGSFATKPESSETPGRFRFRAEFKPPSDAGEYYIRAIGIGDPSGTAGDNEPHKNGGKLEVISENVEVTVKK